MHRGEVAALPCVEQALGRGRDGPRGDHGPGDEGPGCEDDERDRACEDAAAAFRRTLRAQSRSIPPVALRVPPRRGLRPVLHAGKGSRSTGPQRSLGLNLVDVGIILFALALGALGYERGLIASALPLAGFVGGAALGRGSAPRCWPDGSESHYAPLVAVLTGILIGAFVAVALEGIGKAMRRADPGRQRRASSTASAVRCCWRRWRCSSAGDSAPSPFTPAASEARKLREAVQQSAILSALNEALPPSGPAAQRAAPCRPDAAGARARRRRAAARPRRRRRSRGPRRRSRDRAGPRHGLRTRGRRLRLGRGARDSWSPTRTSSPAPTTPRCAPRAATEIEANAVHYDPRNDLAVLEAPGLEAPQLELAPRARKGARGRGDRLPRERAADPHPGPPRADGDGGQPGLLRPRPGQAPDHPVSGRGAQRQLRRAGRRHRRRGGRDRVRRHGRATAPATASAFRTRVVAEALAGRLEPTDTGPCAA